MHFTQLICRTHIGDAYTVYSVLPAVPDIVLSDSESYRFKQLSVPQI